MKNIEILVALALSTLSCAAPPSTVPINVPPPVAPVSLSQQEVVPSRGEKLVTAVWESTPKRVPFLNPNISRDRETAHSSVNHYYLEIPPEHVGIGVAQALGEPHEEAWFYDHDERQLYEIGVFEAVGEVCIEPNSHEFLEHLNPSEVTFLHTHPTRQVQNVLDSSLLTVHQIEMMMKTLIAKTDGAISAMLQENLAELESRIQSITNKLTMIRFTRSIPSFNDWNFCRSIMEKHPTRNLHFGIVFETEGRRGITYYNIAAVSDSVNITSHVETYRRLISQYSQPDALPFVDIYDLQARFIEEVERETGGALSLRIYYFTPEEEDAFRIWAEPQ